MPCFSHVYRWGIYKILDNWEVHDALAGTTQQMYEATVTSSCGDQKALIQQQLKLKYNTLSCSKVLQDDPSMTNYHTANHNLDVMPHASSTLQQFTVPHTPSKVKAGPQAYEKRLGGRLSLCG